MSFRISVLILMFIGNAVCFDLEYESTEITVIPWGEKDEIDKLYIIPPTFYDTSGTPGDVSDDICEQGWGPTHAQVDHAENLYLCSTTENYFKVFDSNGDLIKNFSPGESWFDDRFDGGAVLDFYVDSNQRLYLTSDYALTYVPVFDLSTNMVDSLRPESLHDSVTVRRMDYHSNDVLTFFMSNRTYYTYSNGSINEGGEIGWKAVNGVYYGVRIKSDQLKFYSYSNPNLYGEVNDFQETYIDFPHDGYTSGFMGVDNNLNLYFYDLRLDYIGRVLIFDTSCTQVGEVIINVIDTEYDILINPFLRSDGTIYEFRCENDGLHVVRWAQKK